MTGGTQMGALEALVTEILLAAGLNRTHVRTRTGLELPGYYRPEKKWDLLVVSEERLVLAVEFKSQVGPSFGNNSNNRTEEAIGNAEDVLIAHSQGHLGRGPRPFLGYVFLLEECAEVHVPVRPAEPYFHVDPAFKGASYARRYELLCERLVLQQKYSSACLVLATDAKPTNVTFPSATLNFAQFALAIEAHAQHFLASA